MTVIAVLALLLAADSTPPRHLIYVHGRIIQEQQSARPASPRFGFYELEGIKDAFRKLGFVVSGDIRPKAASVSDSADRLVTQIRELLRTGVPPERVTLVGASMGGGITLLTAVRLQEPKLRFAVLGVCLSENVRSLQASEGKAPAGHILAIREASDEFTTPCPAWTETVAPVGSLVVREIVLKTGLNHGFLYRPLREWVRPVEEWAAQ